MCLLSLSPPVPQPRVPSHSQVAFEVPTRAPVPITFSGRLARAVTPSSPSALRCRPRAWRLARAAISALMPRLSLTKAAPDMETGGLHPSASVEAFLSEGMRVTFKVRPRLPRGPGRWSVR